MTRFDSSGIFGPAHDLPGEDGWFEDLGADDFVDALRSTMREEYADASDEEMGDALTNLLRLNEPGGGDQLRRLRWTGSGRAQVSWRQIRRSRRWPGPHCRSSAGRRARSAAGRQALRLGTMLGGLAASVLPASAAPPAAAASSSCRHANASTTMAAPGLLTAAATSVAVAPEPGAAQCLCPVIADYPVRRTRVAACGGWLGSRGAGPGAYPAA